MDVWSMEQTLKRKTHRSRARKLIVVDTSVRMYSIRSHHTTMTMTMNKQQATSDERRDAKMQSISTVATEHSRMLRILHFIIPESKERSNSTTL
jgi:hypothetical protein